MRSVGASHSRARWRLLSALCAASLAMPAGAGAQAPAPPDAVAASALPVASSSLTKVPPGTTVPPAPGVDGPVVHVAPAPGSQMPPPDADTKAPPSTTEIPPVVTLQHDEAPPPDAAAVPNAYNQAADLYNYQGQQSPAELQQQLQSLQQFLEEGDNITTIGMVVREAHRKVEGGGEVPGLLVVSVMPGSPAAAAGVKGERTGAHSVLEGAAVAASLFFPPAIMAVAIVDGTRVGESYDMIIAVDSVRVTNFLDFNDRMRQVQPGDIIYLTVVRNGKRMQVQVKIPDAPIPPGTSAGVAGGATAAASRAAAAGAAVAR
jgi:PDZ domain-containing protein